MAKPEPKYNFNQWRKDIFHKKVDAEEATEKWHAREIKELDRKLELEIAKIEGSGLHPWTLDQKLANARRESASDKRGLDWELKKKMDKINADFDTEMTEWTEEKRVENTAVGIKDSDIEKIMERVGGKMGVRSEKEIEEHYKKEEEKRFGKGRERRK